MALSATLSPHVLHYVQSVLRLNKPTGLIKRSINRPNIFLYCIPMAHSINSRRDLLFLVPRDIVPQEVRQLPKTMIFMDSRQAVCDMTTTLLGRLPQKYRSADIICDYSTALSESRRHDIMAKFIAGQCRILICTEAAGMGIDVSDVERVIQWTIPRQLNLASFWQQAGQAGRNRQLQAIAILFYKKAQRIPSGVEHPLKLFCEPPNSPSASLVLKRIRAFDAGIQKSQGKRATNSELESQAVEEVGNPGSAHGTGFLRDPTDSNRPANPITNSENVYPEHSAGDGDAQLAQTAHLLDSLREQPNERFGQDIEIEVFDPDLTPTIPGSSQTGYRDSTNGGPTLRTMDRGLLWFLSTTGCRREVIRKYFNDTDILPFPHEVQVPQTDLEGTPRIISVESFPFSCCDNCLDLGQDAPPTSICALLPPSLNTVTPAANIQESPSSINAEVNTEHDQPPELRISKPVSQAHRKLLKVKLEGLRESIWMREGLNKPSGVIVPTFFLQNQHINSLVSRAGSINNIDALAKVLGRHKVDLQFSAIGPYAPEVLEVIVSTLAIELPRAIPQQLGSGRRAACEPASTDPTDANQPLMDRQMGVRVRNTLGRPTRAVRAEQLRLESDIVLEAHIRFTNAEAAGLDSSRWNLNTLGRRRRGRPTFLERQAREQAEAGKQEIADSLINAEDFPLLWARAQEGG